MQVGMEVTDLDLRLHLYISQFPCLFPSLSIPLPLFSLCTQFLLFSLHISSSCVIQPAQAGHNMLISGLMIN